MSHSDLVKMRGLKLKAEKELDQLIKKLKAGTIDRKTLESGLKRVKGNVTEIPWFNK